MRQGHAAERRRIAPLKQQRQQKAAAEQDAEVAARARAAELKAAGVRSKDVARAIAEEFGIARNAAYDISLEA